MASSICSIANALCSSKISFTLRASTVRSTYSSHNFERIAGWMFSLNNDRTALRASQNSRNRGFPSCEIDVRMNERPHVIFSSELGSSPNFDNKFLSSALISGGEDLEETFICKPLKSENW